MQAIDYMTSDVQYIRTIKERYPHKTIVTREKINETDRFSFTEEELEDSVYILRNHCINAILVRWLYKGMTHRDDGPAFFPLELNTVDDEPYSWGLYSYFDKDYKMEEYYNIPVVAAKTRMKAIKHFLKDYDSFVKDPEAWMEQG